MENHVLVGCLDKGITEEQLKKKVVSDFTVEKMILPPQDKLVEEDKNVAILKFKDRADKQKWATWASSKEIRILDSRALAKVALHKDIGQ